MNCTQDGGGALLKRMKTTMLRLLKNPLLAPVKITPLRSHTLIVSNCYCHDRFISEPSAFKSSVCGRGPVADHWSTPLSSLYYKPMKLNVSKVTRVAPPRFPERIVKYQGCSNKQSSVLIAPQSCSLYNLRTACSFLCYEAGIRESMEMTHVTFDSSAGRYFSTWITSSVSQEYYWMFLILQTFSPRETWVLFDNYWYVRWYTSSFLAWIIMFTATFESWFSVQNNKFERKDNHSATPCNDRQINTAAWIYILESIFYLSQLHNWDKTHDNLKIYEQFPSTWY